MERSVCTLPNKGGKYRTHPKKPKMSDMAEKKVYSHGETLCKAGLGFLIGVVLFSTAVDARQDTAHLAFQKTVGRKEGGHIHVVRKGESILSIIRKMSLQKQVSLAEIRRLNPAIRDLNKIYPGQKIIIDLPEQDVQPEKNASPSEKVEEKQIVYKIGKNDSITGIILDRLQVSPAEAINAYRQIRALNPEVEDMNKLPAGSSLLLPPELVKDVPPAPEVKEKVSKAEPVKMHAGLQTLLKSVQPVVEKMGGAVNTVGNYFIPLQDRSQIAIDSSLIPSVELDDGTTVFFDYENRINENVRRLIRQSWRNYHFLTNGELTSVEGTLQGITGLSSRYRMVRVEEPFTVSERPHITVFPDWMITSDRKTPQGSYRQGIFMLGKDEQPLPEGAAALLEKNALAVTMLRGGDSFRFGRQSVPQISRDDLRGFKGIGFVERLLADLGEESQKRTSVDIFRQDVNGFNLSIIVDLLVSRGERKLIVHSRKLPDEFVKILADSGFDLLVINPDSGGISLVESVLQGMGLPVSRGYFSGRFPREGGKSRLEISFSALGGSTRTGQYYLVDFDMPDCFLPMIGSESRATVIRYQ